MSSRRFLGHPRGLVVLAGTELWDRISFNGMKALLVLYMVEQLFLPGHVERIVGIEAFRVGVEAITGPLSIQAFAVQVFGLYMGLISLTPLLGGVVADQLLGRKGAVVLGGLLMTAGHFCMAFDASFLLALLLLILGCGLLRGNLTAQVAELYEPEDRRRAVGFQVYAGMVSLGGFIAPLVSGALSRAHGWHAGFAFAGVGMLVGLAIYLAGFKLLPAEERRARRVRVPLSPDERRKLRVLLLFLPICTLFWIAQSQVWNTYNLWVRDHVDLDIGGYIVPVPWLQALDGLAPLLSLPPLLLFWAWRARRGHEADEVGRMTIGCGLFAAAVLLLVCGAWIVDDAGRSPLLLAVAFHFVSNVGWLYFSPSANSLFAGSAPPSMRATMLGVYTLSVFAGSVISGRLGGFYEVLTPDRFWLIHAGVVALAAAILALFGRRLGAALASPSIPSTAS